MTRIFLAAGLALAANAAAAQEVTLKAITAFAENTTYSRPFERFISRVNQDGKGLVQINYIGGPKAMPPFEVGNALKGGVVDIANATGAFYTNVMPESDAWKLTERPMAELRKNGGYDAMAAIYAQKMNTPVYRDFFQALGATVVQTAPGEVYTALERGVVDGYGWPITGVFDLGWNEKTKYRVDPGFYTAEVSVLVNMASWDRLTDAQKNVLRKAADVGEAEAAADFAAENQKETARQAAGGIQTIKLDGAAAETYRAKAYQAGWEGIIRQSPETGPKLREFFSKAK